MRARIIFMMSVGTLSIGISSVFAEEAVRSVNPPKDSASRMNSGQREKMAALHDKMSACLRSEKAISECQKQMRRECQALKDNEGCPMMGEMGGTIGHSRMRLHDKLHDKFHGKHEADEELHDSD